MASTVNPQGHLEITGKNAPLLDHLRDPLHRALGGRGRFYAVHVEPVGRVGEVLVSITGSRGRLPLLFSPEDLEPGDVFRTVSDTVDKYGF
jgi:hypothetical protein